MTTNNQSTTRSDKKQNSLRPILLVDEEAHKMLDTHAEKLKTLNELMKKAAKLERENASLEHKVIDQEKQFGAKDRQNEIMDKSHEYVEKAIKVRQEENNELSGANQELAKELAKQRNQLQAVHKKLHECEFERKILLDKLHRAWSKPREDAGAGRRKGRLEDQKLIADKIKLIAHLKNEIDEYKKRSTKVRVDMKKNQK